MDAILLAAALQGLLLSFGLLARGRHERGGFFLASLVGLVAISLGIEYAHLVRLVDWQPHLIGLNHSFPFLYSVLLWLYIAALVGFQHRLPVYWHFLPWATHFFFVFLFFYAQSAEYKQLYLRSLEAGRIPLEISITGMAKVAQGLAYTLWSYLLFRKNAEKIGGVLCEHRRPGIALAEDISDFITGELVDCPLRSLRIINGKCAGFRLVRPDESCIVCADFSDRLLGAVSAAHF
jgi:hypothetical protein